jgi:hypothetical protein
MRSRRIPKPDRRRALELLAASPNGCTEALMLAQGFSPELLLDLVYGRLATVSPEQMIVGNKQFEIARVRITEAERKMVVKS